MKLLLRVLVPVLLVGCALPPPAVETAGFVQDKELQGVGLVREALSYLKQSRFIDAELSLRQALYLFPDADNIRENLALALANGDQIEEAEGIFRALAQKYPKSSRHLSNLGEGFFHKYRYDEARIVFIEALELAFARGDIVAASTILRSLAVLEFRVGNEEAALCRSSEAFALKPDGNEALRHARVLLSLHRYDAASKLLFPFVATNPELLPDLNRLMALAAYGQDQFESAKSYAQRILDANTGEFDSRDEIELIAFLTDRRINNTIDGVPSEDELEKISLLSQGASEGQALYWPPNFLKDFLLVKSKVVAAE